MIEVASELPAQVGTPTRLTVTATSPDARPISVTWAGLPADAQASATGGVRWVPADAGTWTPAVTAVDDRGLAASASVRFLARYPARPGTTVAMGDSVAAGHGRDRADYLGGDRCWRAEDHAYGALVHDARSDGDGQSVLVACSGHGTAELRTTPVEADLADVDSGPRPQLDWAVLANPGLITLTVGGNDVDFGDPGGVVVDGSLDRDRLGARLDGLRVGLATALDRLVDATDATIAVTTYYDPSAAVPQGIDGCREACFKAVIEAGLGEVNRVITDVAGGYGERVRVVDLANRFAGHGAPNGVGPDGLRADGDGLLGDLVGDALGAIHPYCAKGDTVGDSWISRVDCVHPNDRGQQEIALAVADVLG
ncbi:MAG: GDSL-type esterase/lipase family protein [Acidimicrobiia bacterium]|nr:GDSL-type esterase/lipase family protein [Acidimicrobiia bacterium]